MRPIGRFRAGSNLVEQSLPSLLPRPRAIHRCLRQHSDLTLIADLPLAKIAILSVPAYGHLNPVLPIAKELVRRGHQVAIFNDENFAPLISATGARFEPYPA